VHVLYEENGELKAGTVLERSPASLHVESPHGRRSKVKSANVLLAFERPAPAQLLGEAETFARSLETQFLWECSGTREFGFEELAREYVASPRRPRRRAS
jgi:exoribonuclease II